MTWGGVGPVLLSLGTSDRKKKKKKKNDCSLGSVNCIAGQTAETLHSSPSKMMGQPCLVSQAADILALKVEMPLSLSPIMEWPV